MESLALRSTTLGAPPRPADIFIRRRPSGPVLAVPARLSGLSGRQRRVIAALRIDNIGVVPQKSCNSVPEKLEMQGFANISSSVNSVMSSTSASQQFPMPPPPSSGFPLFWIGLGVGLSALYSVVAAKLKEHAMQKLFKALMSQEAPQNGHFRNDVFPASPSSQTASSATPVPPQPCRTVDISANKVKVTSPTEDTDETVTREPKNYAFVDVSLEEASDRISQYSDESDRPVERNCNEKEVSPNGTAFKKDSVFNKQPQSCKPQSVLSVEALETMMENPTMQKMFYPYLPVQMRSPITFKRMLQNPQYRRQLEDMLKNMGGSSEWNSRIMDSFKKFDISSPEIKKKFDQIGMKPEEAISKLMANPELATAFQNPKVQAAIMDCSKNPYSIMKYQNDKEVMDVLHKLSQLFPGMSR